MNSLLNCRSCSRLSHHLQLTRKQHPEYHCRPVPAVGDVDGRLLIVGLAPGKHGANASGIPFVGDAAGDLLYHTLQEFGFCQPQPAASDAPWQLLDCRITNAVKCLPPDNKPTAAEISQCNGYLVQEIDACSRPGLILALGQIAHRAVIKSRRLRQADFPFGHGLEHRLGTGLGLIDSYHCSRYNTQTGRLTQAMFRAVFERIRTLLAAGVTQ